MQKVDPAAELEVPEQGEQAALPVVLLNVLAAQAEQAVPSGPCKTRNTEA